MDSKQYNLLLRRRKYTKKIREKTTFLTTQKQTPKRKGSIHRWIKEPRKKVGLAAVFEDTTRRGTLPEESSIHTAEMTAIKIALREVLKKKEKSWVIYTDSQSSMQAIESNKENHPIQNQIYDLLADLKEQKKQITLCKVPAHMVIKGNEEADKAAKEATDMPGLITTRLPYTDYYQTIRRARNSEWQREWEDSTSKLKIIKPRIEEWQNTHNSCRQYEVKLSRLRIGHTRLTHGHLMSRSEQQPTCSNATCDNQITTVKHCLQDCPQWREERRKHGMEGDMKKILGRECEVAKVMKYLKEINIYEDI